MKIFTFLCAFCTIVWSYSGGVNAYTIPNVKLELTETGFRVSIPDEPGVKYVAFNINRNRNFKSFEPGEISVQIRERSKECNCWVYEGTRKLQNTDIVYIWINVQHNQLVYRSVSAPISVFDLQNTLNGGTDARPTASFPVPSEQPPKGGAEGECLPSITMVRNRTVCKGQLIFEDNFDSILNTRVWKPEVYLAPDTTDAEFVFYDDSQLKVNDGELIITPLTWNEYNNNINIKTGTLNIRDRCTGVENPNMQCYREAGRHFQSILPPIVSGRLSTKESFSFKYGQVEIRAKLPKGDWLFPLILLEPLRNHYGSDNYASGQLRIAFARGNNNLWTLNNVDIGGKALYGGAVTSKDPNLRDHAFVRTVLPSHLGDAYHLYTMIWTDEKITFKIDGQVYGEIPAGFDNENPFVKESWKKGGKLAPFDDEFFLTLGVSAGGHGDFPDNIVSNGNPKPWNNTSPKALRSFWKARSNWKSTWGRDKSLHVQYVGVYAV